MISMEALELRLRELEVELKLKDEELELAAQLGQALVKKETKQAEQLEHAHSKIRELEQEVAGVRAEKAMLVGEAKDPNVESGKGSEFAKTIRALEEENNKLRYELKRLQFKYEHVKHDVVARKEIEGNDDDITKLREAVQQFNQNNALEELKQLHEKELVALKEGNEQKIQEYIQNSQQETRRLMERMEQQLDILRQQVQGQLDEGSRLSLASSMTPVSIGPSISFGSSISSMQQHQRQASHPFNQTFSRQLVSQFLPEMDSFELERQERQDLSFVSKFSTDTLELDLGEISRDEMLEDVEQALAQQSLLLDESREITESIEEDEERLEETVTGSSLMADLPKLTQIGGPGNADRRGPAPPLPTRPKLVPAVDFISSEMVCSAPECSHDSFGNSCDKRQAESGFHFKETKEDEPERDDLNLREILQQDPSRVDLRKGESGKEGISTDLQEGENKTWTGESTQSSRRSSGSSSKKSSKSISTKSSAYAAEWATARKGTLLVKMANARRSDKWSARFCVYTHRQLFIFRTESDAIKYSGYWAQHEQETKSADPLASSKTLLAGSSKKLSFRPLRIISLDQSELRVLRRPSAQNEAESDARSSMLAWLRKRNFSSSSSSETAEVHGGTQHKRVRPNFKIHLVEHDHHTLSSVEGSGYDTGLMGSSVSDLTSEAGSSTSGTSVSTFSTSVSNVRYKHHVYLAMAVEAERTAWVEEFMRTSHTVQVEAGSVWIKSVGRKRDGDWIKRYAVVRPGRLDLHDYDSESLRETVSLASVKVEPAYTAHIFISHKLHQKQLVTLRTYDSTERNWWIAAIRSCCPRKTVSDGSHSRSGSNQNSFMGSVKTVKTIDSYMSSAA